ncbi:hypothetical protein [Halobacillus seohaensis]|uniref:Uncharacterized protein n=1 Tax=Halobacillus seohaensis TaxID=447421 RepID=A0ABW2EKD6_9BACI
MNNQRVSTASQMQEALLVTDIEMQHINHWYSDLEDENATIHLDLQHGLNDPCKIVMLSDGFCIE